MAYEEKKRKRRAPIIIGVVALVLVAAGVGFAVWHEQPSFCNAICHTPMDYYVESYESDDAAQAASAHRVHGKSCLDCHESDLGTQISEATTWATSDYAVVESGALAQTRVVADEPFCFRCHDDGQADNGADWDVVVESTAEWDSMTHANPHAGHDSSITCGDCHKAHEPSVMYCNKCHGFAVPEGWNNYY